MTRLRQTLERAGIDRSRLQFSADSYALRVPVEIDWVRFQRLSRDAAALTEAGDEEAAASVLADALAMWRSEPLAEAVGAWAQAMRETMLGSYQAVLAQRAHLALRLGRPGAVIGDLQTAASAHPLNEGLVGGVEATLTKERRLSVVEEQLKILDGPRPGQETLGLGNLLLRWHPALAEELRHPFLALLADRIDPGQQFGHTRTVCRAGPDDRTEFPPACPGGQPDHPGPVGNPPDAYVPRVLGERRQSAAVQGVGGCPDVRRHLPLHGITNPAPLLRFLNGGRPPRPCAVQPGCERVHADRVPCTPPSAFRGSPFTLGNLRSRRHALAGFTRGRLPAGAWPTALAPRCGSEDRSNAPGAPVASVDTATFRSVPPRRRARSSFDLHPRAHRVSEWGTWPPGWM